MDGYRVALFFHLLAVVAASATAAVVHLAQVRYARADTRAAAREWHRLLRTVARAFPLATLTLVGTGSYMVAATGGRAWGVGWVEAGIAGAVLLLLSGAVLAARGRALGQALAGLAAEHGTLPVDSVAGTLMWANTGLALGVMFVMTAKPALPASLAVLAAGAGAGAVLALLHLRAAAPVAAGEAVEG